MSLDVRVTVVSTNPLGQLDGRENFQGIEVRRFFGFSPNESYFFAPSLYRYLASVKDSYAIIHAHNYQAAPSLMAALAKKRNHLPLIFTPHFHPMGGTSFRAAIKTAYRKIGKITFDLSDIVIALSELERRNLKSLFDVADSKIRVIAPGSIPRQVTTRRCKQDIILYVGRLEEYKGLEYLIRIIPIVRRQLPSLQLLIVGSGPDESRLRRIAGTIGVSSYVEFLGNVSSAELDNLYRQAKLVGLLSQYEAYSFVIGEALEYGVPVLATRVGAIPEIYGHEKGCVLIDYPPSIKELANKIIEIVTKYDAGSATKATARRLTWKEVAS